ncbi:bifunctional riboflavin kinase/FAD synthetase [Merismopedia glauca]|uniref:bifunctional riboflavin kinase/FAD synthetase n=1 Tax=Merismopedia glauca TaxID=292586 RepID=UPI001C635C72|nr:bifunctional riboflavin kinase/FAD synthetase [Merismopedia glauca]
METALTPTTVALGNFDGVHRGHLQVVQAILPSNLPESVTDAYPTVVTFDPHPQEFFSGQKKTLLTTVEEKVTQLRSLGVKQVVVLPFNQSLAKLTPQEFVEDILVQKLQATCVSVGENFCFGSKRSGTTADLQTIAAKFGIEVIVVPLYKCGGDRISSSLIREALLNANLDTANRFLGRPYPLTGTVVAGKQLGRTIGFPTANLELPPEKFLPQSGVYCVEILINGQTIELEPHPLQGVMNIGNRPTVDGTVTTVEVHIFNWSGDLYGREITVSLGKFLRSEQKFANLDALKNQIAADCQAAKAFFT